MPCDEVQRKLVAFADDRLSAPGAVLEEGGDMLQPWQSPPWGLGMEILAALFLMPAVYVIMTRSEQKGIVTS